MQNQISIWLGQPAWVGVKLQMNAHLLDADRAEVYGGQGRNHHRHGQEFSQDDIDLDEEGLFNLYIPAVICLCRIYTVGGGICARPALPQSITVVGPARTK